jgi:hypothetical protein
VSYCTGAPNLGKETQSCCKRHDFDYSPESKVSRRDADILLLLCVAERGMPWRAIVMFILVRLFGWMFYKGKVK